QESETDLKHEERGWSDRECSRQPHHRTNNQYRAGHEPHDEQPCARQPCGKRRVEPSQGNPDNGTKSRVWEKTPKGGNAVTLSSESDFDDAAFEPDRDGVGPVVGAQLGEDIPDASLDGLFGDG